MKNMCVLEKHVALAIKGKRIEIHVSQSYLDFHLDLFFIVYFIFNLVKLNSKVRINHQNLSKLNILKGLSENIFIRNWHILLKLTYFNFRLTLQKMFWFFT